VPIQEFQRDVLADVRVHRFVHGAHAATAEHADNAIFLGNDRSDTRAGIFDGQGHDDKLSIGCSDPIEPKRTMLSLAGARNERTHAPGSTVQWALCRAMTMRRWTTHHVCLESILPDEARTKAFQTAAASPENLPDLPIFP
jgi:hypothetical protein